MKHKDLARKRKINRDCERRRAAKKRARYLDNKFMFMRVLGGKCELCGFGDHRALQFDHIDPHKKSRNLPSFFRAVDLANAFDEAHNCRLLCANCHAIITHDSGRLRLGKTYIQEAA